MLIEIHVRQSRMLEGAQLALNIHILLGKSGRSPVMLSKGNCAICVDFVELAAEYDDAPGTTPLNG